jgi:hypothetical protein
MFLGDVGRRVTLVSAGKNEQEIGCQRFHSETWYSPNPNSPVGFSLYDGVGRPKSPQAKLSRKLGAPGLDSETWDSTNANMNFSVLQTQFMQNSDALNTTAILESRIQYLKACCALCIINANAY